MAEHGKRQTRSRTIEYQFDEAGRVVNRDDVQQALIDFEAVLATLGGMLAVGAIRAVTPQEEYVTIGVKLEWASFAPAVGKIPGPPEPVPLTEPELEVEEPDMAETMDRAEEATGVDERGGGRVADPELKPVA